MAQVVECLLRNHGNRVPISVLMWPTKTCDSSSKGTGTFCQPSHLHRGSCLHRYSHLHSLCTCTPVFIHPHRHSYRHIYTQAYTYKLIDISKRILIQTHTYTGKHIWTNISKSILIITSITGKTVPRTSCHTNTSIFLRFPRICSCDSFLRLRGLGLDSHRTNLCHIFDLLPEQPSTDPTPF